MSDVLTDLASIAATSYAEQAAYMQRTLAENSVLYHTVMDLSYAVTSPAKQLDVPRITNLTAIQKTALTAVEYQGIVSAVDSIVFGQPYAVPALIADAARNQSAVLTAENIYNKMQAAMVEKIEALIASKLVKATNSIQLTGGTNDRVALADINDAIAQYKAAKNPFDGNVFLAVPALQEGVIRLLLKDSGFVKADGLLGNGVIGTLWGVNVVCTNSFASSTEFVLYHKEHVGFAFGFNGAAKLETNRIGKHLSDEIILSASFGAVQMNAGTMGIYADETALV